MDPNNTKIGEKVCLRLTSYFNDGKKRTLTADNFFSSYDLVSKLYNANYSYVGTLRRNKPHIPLCFQASKSRALLSSLFCFKDEKTIVSYVPKPNKVVILISSEHHSSSISDNECKPEIILFYNRTKGSVDAVDQKIEKYTCRRKSNRFLFFFNLFKITFF